MNNLSATELPVLLRASDVKVYLGCNDNKLYALLKRRDFPSFRIDRKWYVDKEEFIAWMKKSMVKKK
ncbi:MAG: helix-turn-helix domain-containing protein [Oscillospiraceae bacterium]|nr:helix-turn-helix domain-containing protein [Oscillospiraceae bacterium]